jgi:hypothetical protein
VSSARNSLRTPPRESVMRACIAIVRSDVHGSERLTSSGRGALAVQCDRPTLCPLAALGDGHDNSRLWHSPHTRPSSKERPPSVVRRWKRRGHADGHKDKSHRSSGGRFRSGHRAREGARTAQLRNSRSCKVGAAAASSHKAHCWNVRVDLTVASDTNSSGCQKPSTSTTSTAMFTERSNAGACHRTAIFFLAILKQRRVKVLWEVQ